MMIRILGLAATLIGLVSVTVSRADDPTPPRGERKLPVAPPPREVRSDGSRDPAPEPEPTTPDENPAETVNRIVKNSKVVGDKLAMTDTGMETRSTQDKILKDIDSLINRQDPPPKSGGGGGGGGGGADDKSQSNDKNAGQDKNQGKGEGKGSSGGEPKEGGMPPPKGGQNQGGGMPPPGGEGKEGGQNQANSGRRPRGGSEKTEPQPKGPGKDQGKGSEMAGNNGQEEKKGPMPGGKEPMGGKDMTAGGGPGKPTRPTMPLDEEVVKDVWGHLPDKLRQQVTQYYKEQFMPKYSDLLKQYYSSLANTPTKPPAEMRR